MVYNARYPLIIILLVRSLTYSSPPSLINRSPRRVTSRFAILGNPCPLPLWLIYYNWLRLNFILIFIYFWIWRLSCVKELDLTPRTRAIGTPIFMSPEVLQGTPSNEKSDVYAYALLLWVCIYIASSIEQLRTFLLIILCFFFNRNCGLATKGLSVTSLRLKNFSMMWLRSRADQP